MLNRGSAGPSTLMTLPPPAVRVRVRAGCHLDFGHGAQLRHARQRDDHRLVRPVLVHAGARVAAEHAEGQPRGARVAHRRKHLGQRARGVPHAAGLVQPPAGARRLLLRGGRAGFSTLKTPHDLGSKRGFARCGPVWSSQRPAPVACFCAAGQAGLFSVTLHDLGSKRMECQMQPAWSSRRPAPVLFQQRAARTLRAHGFSPVQAFA